MADTHPDRTTTSSYTWVYEETSIDWVELSELYRRAPLGEKPPGALMTTFGNSLYKCFVFEGERLVGAGRALADGLDCAYLADVAVLPEHQGRGLGKAIIDGLVQLAAGHKKIILYANPGTEGFYLGLGFLPMNTAMAIWNDQQWAIERGLLREK